MTNKYNIPELPFNGLINGECAVFQDAGNGVCGRLMFLPDEIIKVCAEDPSVEYKRGTDWDWDAVTCRLTRPEGSAIPFFTAGDLAGAGIKGWGQEPVGFDAEGKARIGNAVYCENEWMWGKRFYVTYRTSETGFPKRNTFRPDLLPKTMKKLRAGQPLRMVFFGDSTHTGADTSSWYKRAPFTPGYPVMFTECLSELYGSQTTLINHSVGGKDSVWALTEFKRCVIDEKPDVLFLGFGNNDTVFGTGINTVLKNIKYMIDETQKAFPDCEIVLLGISINNPDSGFMLHSWKLHDPYRAMERVGLRYFNCFEMGLDLLARKDFAALCGNGIAHPNDWTTKIYAANLLSLFTDKF